MTSGSPSPDATYSGQHGGPQRRPRREPRRTPQLNQHLPHGGEAGELASRVARGSSTVGLCGRSTAVRLGSHGWASVVADHEAQLVAQSGSASLVCLARSLMRSSGDSEAEAPGRLATCLMLTTRLQRGSRGRCPGLGCYWWRPGERKGSADAFGRCSMGREQRDRRRCSDLGKRDLTRSRGTARHDH